MPELKQLLAGLTAGAAAVAAAVADDGVEVAAETQGNQNLAYSWLVKKMQNMSKM